MKGIPSENMEVDVGLNGVEFYVPSVMRYSSVINLAPYKTLLGASHLNALMNNEARENLWSGSLN
jgi:hypothetical protein